MEVWNILRMRFLTTQNICCLYRNLTGAGYVTVEHHADYNSGNVSDLYSGSTRPHLYCVIYFCVTVGKRRRLLSLNSARFT